MLPTPAWRSGGAPDQRVSTALRDGQRQSSSTGNSSEPSWCGVLHRPDTTVLLSDASLPLWQPTNSSSNVAHGRQGLPMNTRHRRGEPVSRSVNQSVSHPDQPKTILSSFLLVLRDPLVFPGTFSCLLPAVLGMLFTPSLCSILPRASAPSQQRIRSFSHPEAILVCPGGFSLLFMHQLSTTKLSRYTLPADDHRTCRTGESVARAGRKDEKRLVQRRRRGRRGAPRRGESVSPMW